MSVVLVIAAVAGVVLLIASPSRAAGEGKDATSVDAVIELHARDLHDQLSRKIAILGGVGRRIAIWPYAPDERLPISHDQARFLNDRLEHALQLLSQGTYDFKGRRELRTVIRDLAESGDELDDPIAVVKAHAAADILIIGRISITGERLVSNFKAVALRNGRTGSILATSRTRELPSRLEQQRVLLAQFLRHAATALVKGAPDLTELHQAGIQFQDSGQQPLFGSYMERMLAAEIAETFRRKGRRIVIKRAGLNQSQLGGMRGKPVDPKKLKRRNFDPRTGVYILSGTYWDIGKGVDLELRLSDAGGAPVAFRGGIVKSSIGAGLALHPETDLAFLRRKSLRGPIQLGLTSGRGKDPVYRVDEKLDLLIRVSRDAWLYCFYLQSNGELLKIYPNGFAEPAALAGGRLHTIPGRIYPFEFTLTEPAGVELVKCFASARNMTGDLPEALRRPEVAPLPAGMARRLRDVFARAGKGEVSEASLVISVDR